MTAAAGANIGAVGTPSVTSSTSGTTTTFTFNNLKGATGATGTRGSRWNQGTAVTGTSTTGTVFSGTGITDALVGDYYLNTETGGVYRCTTAGNASTAKWAYACSLKGGDGTVVTDANEAFPLPDATDYAKGTDIVKHQVYEVLEGSSSNLPVEHDCVVLSTLYMTADA